VLKRNTVLYAANVHFYGGVHEDDPREEPVQAWVEAQPPPEIAPGRDALSLLLPLLGANHMIISVTGEPSITEGFASELESAAEQLLESEAAARALTFGADFGGIPMPELIETAPEGGSDRVLETALMRGRGRRATWWSRTGAPVQGGGYFAPVGNLMLIQHAAKRAPYEDTLVRIALGTRVALGMFDAARSAEDLPALLPDFNKGVSSLVLAEDPRAEWDRRQAASPSG